MDRRRCINNPDRFCYICGKITWQKISINSKIKYLYKTYFGVKLGDQDKQFAPHICCPSCVRNLNNWSRKKISKLAFGIPMKRREGKDHSNDCYFCMTNLKGKLY